MNFNEIVHIHTQLGGMSLPFALLSGLMLMIILERLFFIMLHGKTQTKKCQAQLKQLNLDDPNACDGFINTHRQNKNTLVRGLSLLMQHRDLEKSLREETVSLWLQDKRRRYVSGLKLLNVIGILSPLVGLLGTVMGLIEMFKGLSGMETGISPAALADGLGLAMSTTAVGLCIALPAIGFAHVFSIWADRSMAKMEFVLNHFNLHLSRHNTVEQHQQDSDISQHVVAQEATL